MYPGPPPQWGPPPWPRPQGPSLGWAVALWVVMAGCLAGALLFGTLAVLGFRFDRRWTPG